MVPWWKEAGTQTKSHIQALVHVQYMRGSRGGGVSDPRPREKLGFLSNTGPDPLKNHKATKPAFNVGLLSARQRIAN